MSASTTKRIQPARGWCVTVGEDCANCTHLSRLYGGLATQFMGKPAVRPRSMAGGAPTPCGRHWVQSRTKTNTKTLSHTRTQPPTFTKYTNLSVQPPQPSPIPLYLDHSPPKSPTSVQPPKTEYINMPLRSALPNSPSLKKHVAPSPNLEPIKVPS